MIWLQLGVTELRTGIIALKQLAIVSTRDSYERDYAYA
jgi:hypothetical protein